MKSKIIFNYLQIIIYTMVAIFIVSCSNAPKALSKSKKGMEKVVEESLEQSSKKKDDLVSEMQQNLLENAENVPEALNLIDEALINQNNQIEKKERPNYPWELNIDYGKEWRKKMRQDSLFAIRLKEKRRLELKKIDSLRNISNKQ